MRAEERRCFLRTRNNTQRATDDDPDAAECARLPEFQDLSFQDVLGSMPGVAYVEAEGPTGMTAYISPRIEALTGYPPERFTESRAFWYSLVHPDNRERVEPPTLRPDAAPNRIWRSTAWSSRATHDLGPGRGRARRRVRGKGGALDRPDRGHRQGEGGEERAAEVKHRYRTLVEQLPIVTYIDAPDASLENLFVSPQVNDLLGRPSGSTGEEWAERVHPDNRERAHRETVEGVATGDPSPRVPHGEGRRKGHLGTRLRNHRAQRRGRTRIRPRVLLRHHEAEGSRASARGAGAALPQPGGAAPGSDVYGHGRRRFASIYVSPQVESVLGLSADAFVSDDAWAGREHPEDRDEAVRGSARRSDGRSRSRSNTA